MVFWPSQYKGRWPPPPSAGPFSRRGRRAHARPADALRDWAMASYAISSSMPATTAALLEHAMAGRAQALHIGAQTSPHSLFIRYRISTKAEGIILASRLLLLCISGCGSRKANHGQCERKRDHLLHRGTPVRTETAARVVIGKRAASIYSTAALGRNGTFSPSNSSRSSPRTRRAGRPNSGQ